MNFISCKEFCTRHFVKKIFSIFLSLIIIISITEGLKLSAYAETASGICGYNLIWTLDDEGTLTISGTGSMNNYDGYDNCSPWHDKRYLINTIVVNPGVTSIGDYAFFGCSRLTDITIPNSITRIGDNPFEFCERLTKVNINSIESWCNVSFSSMSSNPLSCAHNLYLNGCLVTDLVIPNSVSYIGERTFKGCTSLTSVTIPDSVTSIGPNAFSGCTSIISLIIPDSVKRIHNYAFDHVKNVVYNGSATGSPWGANAINGYVDGYFIYKDSTKKELLGCSGQATEVTIPNSVTSIGNSAFYNCTSLTSVTIPNSVTSIGYRAFEKCRSLTSVTIPDNVTSIEWDAFSCCTSLISIKLPNGITSIESGMFSSCENLMNIEIPNSVTSIGGYAFSSCTSLTSVTISDSVTSIGDSAFSWCTSLTSVIIGNSVTSIGSNAFYDCTSLTSIEIPNSVTSIGNDAFSWCTSLTNVKLGNSVTSIGNYAFSYCRSLTDVYYSNSECSWNKISIGSNNQCLTNANIHFTFSSICINHIFAKVEEVQPNCIDEGYIVYLCENCEYTYTEYLDNLGHIYMFIDYTDNTLNYECAECERLNKKQISRLPDFNDEFAEKVIRGKSSMYLDFNNDGYVNAKDYVILHDLIG